jgi:hypothetical protein
MGRVKSVAIIAQEMDQLIAIVAAAVVIAGHVVVAEKKVAPIVAIAAEHGAVHAEGPGSQANTIAIQNRMLIKPAILVPVAEHRTAPVALEADIPGAMVAMAQGIAMYVVAARLCNAAIVQEVGK